MILKNKTVKLLKKIFIYLNNSFGGNNFTFDQVNRALKDLEVQEKFHHFAHALFLTENDYNPLYTDDYNQERIQILNSYFNYVTHNANHELNFKRIFGLKKTSPYSKPGADFGRYY